MRYAIFTLLVMLFAGLSFSADVADCMVINESGAHTLTDDLAGAPLNASGLGGKPEASACIIIAASDVVLDCEGHSLTNTAVPDSFGIVINSSSGDMRDNITITGCEVSQYERGIHTRAATNVTMEGNDVHDNTIGIVADIASDGVFLEGNEVHGNSVIGVGVAGNMGVLFGFLPTNVTIEADHYYGNGYDLWVEGLGISGYPAYVEMFDTIFDSPSGDRSRFTNLTMGDLVAAGSSYAISWEDTPPSTVPGHITFRDAYLNITPMSGTVMLDWLVWRWTAAEGSYPYDESLFRLYKYNGSWTDTGASPNTGSDFIDLVNHVPSSTYAIVQNASCPSPITSSGTHVLTGPVAGAPNVITSFSNGLACVRIAASDVVFDCQGYPVVNDGTGIMSNMTVGIIADGDYQNITVQNCPSVTGYTYGVGLDHADDSVVRNVTAHANGHAGIYIARGGDRNNITNCTSFGHPVAGIYTPQYAESGFYIYSGADNRLWDNVAYDNTYGFDVRSGVGGNVLSDNEAYFNTHGIHVQSNDNMNSIENNYAHDNDYGITLSASSHEELLNNTAEDNLVHGFYLLDSASNDLYNNTAYDSGSAGFYLDNADSNHIEGSFALGNVNAYELRGLSDGNELRDNVAQGNNAEGFYIYSGHDNILVGNIAANNTNRGFYLASGTSSGNYLQLDQAYGNTHGLVLINTNSNNVTACEFFNNTDTGAVIMNSHDNIFMANDAYGNGVHGYSLTPGSDDNIFALEESFDNGIDGFFIRDCGSNTYMLCDVYRNGDEGFEVRNSSGNNFTLNSLVNNSVGFYLHLGSQGNLLEGNEVYGSGFQGYYLDSGSEGNTLQDNIAIDNSAEGFLIEGTALNSLIGNGAYGNSFGLRVRESNDTVMQGNTFAQNLELGAYIFDSNHTSFDGDHFYDNSRAMRVESAFFHGFILNLSGVVFDSPLGNLTNYTNLSLDDDVSLDGSYSLFWSPQTGALPFTATKSFEGKFLNLTRDFGAFDIDIMTWHWTDAEAAPYIESNLFLWRHDGVQWGIVNSFPDTVANELTLTNVVDPGETSFAIMEFGGSPDDDDGGGGADESLSIGLESGCEGNTVTISDGDGLEGASVSVFDAVTLLPIATGTTDSDGEFLFEGCGIDVRIHANHEDYSASTVIRPLVDCSICEVECEEDDDCAAEEMCLISACVPVDCPCGEIEDHACSAYECCSDTHCEDGFVCSSHSCIPEEEEPACSMDSDCDGDEYCDAGDCTPLTGSCGYIDNHMWVDYECGTDPACPECGPGRECQDHLCVETQVRCPESGLVGDTPSCKAQTGDEPCAGCDYVITDPLGKEYTGKTGADGSIELPLSLQGMHKVAVLKDGVVVSEVEVEAKPKGTPSGEDKPPAQADDLPFFAFLLLILVVLALLVFYWRKRGGSSK